MRVFELARDLNVSTRMLLTLLRKMGVALHGDRDFVPGDDVSRLLARIERERRQGGGGNPRGGTVRARGCPGNPRPPEAQSKEGAATREQRVGGGNHPVGGGGCRGPG